MSDGNDSDINATGATDLAHAIAALAAGGIVCFPTESSYGLGVRSDRPAALARLATLKGRVTDSPFGLVAGDIGQARSLARCWPVRAQALAVAHWPGPLTLVVTAALGLPPELVGPSGGVGIRVPSADIARLLPLEAGVPVTATSANPSGQPPAESVEQARSYFGDAVAVYIDGGPAGSLVPSTLVSVGAEGQLCILRPGAIVIQETDT